MRVDVDLRHGISSAGARDIASRGDAVLRISILTASAYDLAVLMSPSNSQSTVHGICQQIQYWPMPFIYFNPTPARHVPEIIWRCSTRVLLQYELYQLR